MTKYRKNKVCVLNDLILTSCMMYSHILSLTGCVRESALIARSISPIMPSCGCGNWPERMMDAVVIEEGSEPIIGEEDIIAELSATHSDYMSKTDQAIDVPPLFMCR
jgi:hypothetical protein